MLTPLLAALALLAPTAEGPDPEALAILATNPVMIADPHWAQKPTSREMSSAYPSYAMRREKDGEARLICRVRLDGSVSACGVLSETRDGVYGFGQAALGLTPKFRLTPKTVEGMPIDGAAVIIPVIFTQQPFRF